MADVKNMGNRYGGAITAALFLKGFVGKVPWAHLDVAGTAFSDRGNSYWPRGATGAPARTFIRYVEAWAEKHGAEASSNDGGTRRSSNGVTTRARSSPCTSIRTMPRSRAGGPWPNGRRRAATSTFWC